MTSEPAVAFCEGWEAFECGHPHWNPVTSPELISQALGRAVRCLLKWALVGRKVERMDRRPWRADHVANTSNIEPLCWLIITANYHVVIALYSGGQLLMNAGKGEMPMGRPLLAFGIRV